MATNCKI